MTHSPLYRVSTSTQYNNAVRNLQTRQSELADLQEKMTAGKRVIRPSDDPAAAAQAERALSRIARLQAQQRALGMRREAIAQAEAALGETVELVQQIRELVVSAGNGAHNKAQDYAIVANQIQNLREQLTSVINRTDANGQALLGALGSALKSFEGPLLSWPDYQFNGLPGQNSSGSNHIPGALDGHAAVIFDPVRDGIYQANINPRGNGSSLTTSAIRTRCHELLGGASYALHVDSVTTDPASGGIIVGYTLTKADTNGVTSISTASAGPAVKGQPIGIAIKEGDTTVIDFALHGVPAVGDTIKLHPSHSLMGSIDSAIRGIGHAKNKTDVSQAVGQALSNIDAGLERLVPVRSYAGALLGRADHIRDSQSQRALGLEEERSRAEDMDLFKGISDTHNMRTAYEAALQSYAKVQRLSLFDYMR